MFSPADFTYMEHALALAARGLYTTTPNPRVGCVLVKNDRVIGEGFTQPAGHDHAELHALKDARAHGCDPSGATAYVSLEPCSHFGRTPPCANTLITARVARVIAAMEDPHPQVSGRGLKLLRDAGIEVRCGLLAQQARELNIGFISRITRGRPWVRLKLAASLDARTALPDGASQWITSAAARADGHAWRARACAILTGIGTVQADNPQLTVRAVDTPRQPRKIIIDSALGLPLDARILDGEAPLIVCASTDGDRAAKAEQLRARGAELLALASPRGKVDLPALMLELGRRGLNELHAEAGCRLSSALLASACVDELLIYLAPCLLGDAIPMFRLAPPAMLDQRPLLAFHSVDRIGDDLRIVARLLTSPAGMPAGH